MSTPEVGDSLDVETMSRILDLPALISPGVCFTVVIGLERGRDSIFFAEMEEKKQAPNSKANHLKMEKLLLPENFVPLFANFNKPFSRGWC